MSGNYREYGYDVSSPKLHRQIQEDISEAKEIEKRAEEIRSKKGEEITKDKLGKEEVTKEEIEAVLNNYASNENEYLVNGAILTCDKAKRGSVKIKIGNAVVEFEGNNSMSYKYARLNVKENGQSDNGLYVATIGDAEKDVNIVPFRCNCSLLPDRQWEIDKIKNNLNYCKTYGTCSQLMDLDDEWDNLPSDTSYFTYTDVSKDGSEEKEAINMMSMLFCKHGGLITPVTSGQVVLQYNLKELKISSNHIALSNTTIQPAKTLKLYTQKKIQDLCNPDGVVYFDESGYQRVRNTGLDSDPYLVAIAEYYQKAAIDEGVGDYQAFGAIYKVTFSSKKEIFVTMGDLKDPADTKEAWNNEEENFYAGTGESANTLEFICNYNNYNPDFYSDNMISIHGTDRNWGKALTITDGAEITSIELLTDTEIEWEKYFNESDGEVFD